MKRVLTAAIGIPIVIAATLYSPHWLFALIVALVSCYIYYATADLLARRWQRLLLAAVPWLLPLVPYELLGIMSVSFSRLGSPAPRNDELRLHSCPDTTRRRVDR